MYGADQKQKFAQARALYLYMFAHPGKKLNFMGAELGMLREWSEARELDWALEDDPQHQAFHAFFRALCQLYRAHPALWTDYAPGNFSWFDRLEDAPCVFAFTRSCPDERLAAVFNLSDEPYAGCVLPVGSASVLLSTESGAFGGALKETACSFLSNQDETTLDFPPFSGFLLQIG